MYGLFSGKVHCPHQGNNVFQCSDLFSLCITSGLNFIEHIAHIPNIFSLEVSEDFLKQTVDCNNICFRKMPDVRILSRRTREENKKRKANVYCCLISSRYSSLLDSGIRNICIASSEEQFNVSIKEMIHFKVPFFSPLASILSSTSHIFLMSTLSVQVKISSNRMLPVRMSA